MIFKILSIINIVLLVMALLNTWLPITFERLRWVEIYKIVILFPICTFIGVKYFKENHVLPSVMDIDKILFTNDVATRVMRYYAFYFLSFIVYQTLLIILL